MQVVHTSFPLAVLEATYSHMKFALMILHILDWQKDAEGPIEKTLEDWETIAGWSPYEVRQFHAQLPLLGISVEKKRGWQRVIFRYTIDQKALAKAIPIPIDEQGIQQILRLFRITQLQSSPTWFVWKIIARWQEHFGGAVPMSLTQWAREGFSQQALETCHHIAQTVGITKKHQKHGLVNYYTIEYTRLFAALDIQREKREPCPTYIDRSVTEQELLTVMSVYDGPVLSQQEYKNNMRLIKKILQKGVLPEEVQELLAFFSKAAANNKFILKGQTIAQWIAGYFLINGQLEKRFYDVIRKDMLRHPGKKPPIHTKRRIPPWKSNFTLYLQIALKPARKTNYLRYRYSQNMQDLFVSFSKHISPYRLARSVEKLVEKLKTGELYIEPKTFMDIIKDWYKHNWHTDPWEDDIRTVKNPRFLGKDSLYWYMTWAFGALHDPTLNQRNRWLNSRKIKLCYRAGIDGILLRRMIYRAREKIREGIERLDSEEVLMDIVVRWLKENGYVIPVEYSQDQRDIHDAAAESHIEIEPYIIHESQPEEPWGGPAFVPAPRACG